VARVKLKKQKKSLDKKLLALVVVLMGAGLIAVADASAPQALNYFNDRLYFAKQQAIWALVGLVALLGVSKLHYSTWEKLAKPLFFLSVVGLAVVLVPGVGVKSLGARRWLSIFSYSFQPSELIKLTLAVYFAKLASKKMPPLSYFVPLGLVVGLIMLEPDLGTALVVGTIGMVQIFVSGINLAYFLGAGVVSLLIGFLFVVFSDYRRDRVMTFLRQTTDPLGKSYHIRQILLALGSGGLFGVGLGQSRQKYLFLPEAATDSIFAVIAEELGFIGATVVIGLFMWFISRALKVASSAPDRFSKVLSLGLITWIGGQAFLNIGSMVALVPLTGIPLPFLSYGGSSLVTTMIAAGILLNISRYGKRQK
jgi:cell division protein FtsW